MDRVRWGVLSTARIARLHVLPALQQARLAEVVALALRELERASALAAAYPGAKAYGGYDELLADPNVDAVYIPLPNDQHVAWSLAALAAGKHVLCEKPIAMTADEAQTLAHAAADHPRLKVMEAFMYRFHPQWQKTKALVTQRAIGELRTIQSFFAYSNLDPSNIRNMVEHGGGALMDIGCYCISLARWLFEQEPTRVTGIVDYDPAFGTDRVTSALLDFGNGTSTFTCATQVSAYQRVNIFGSTGRIEIEIPFNAPEDRPCRLWHTHDSTVDEVVFEVSNQYAMMADAFSQAIIDDGPVPTPIDDAVANMRVIDAVVRSAREQHWVLS
jgi:predicted dehydrogenase